MHILYIMSIIYIISEFIFSCGHFLFLENIMNFQLATTPDLLIWYITFELFKEKNLSKPK